MNWIQWISSGSRREKGSLFQPFGSSKTKSANQELSIMFVDIVGFSISAEKMSPDEVFGRLRELLSPLSEIVHRHHGIIDKTIGDGFLCFFGVGQKLDKNGRTHAGQAIDCACELQRYAIERSLRAQGEGVPVFPLRIGINTATVFLGDIGGPRRTEYTIFGHGVNVAQRLEGACESFRVLISKETLLGWSKFRGGSISIHKRRVQMKHREEVFEAYEINPFESEPEKLSEAMQNYREVAGLVRREERYNIDSRLPLSVHTDRIDCRILNYSRSGLAVEADFYLGKGTIVSISPEGSDHQLDSLFRVHGVAYTILAEVRWGAVKENTFVHGLKLINLTEEQKEALYNALRELGGEVNFSLSKAGQ